MLSRRQMLQSLAASAAGALAPSQALSQSGASGSARRPTARRSSICDFDVTPYLAQLKSAGVKTIGRYYDRAYGSGIGETCYHHPMQDADQGRTGRDRERRHVGLSWCSSIAARSA